MCIVHDIDDFAVCVVSLIVDHSYSKKICAYRAVLVDKSVNNHTLGRGKKLRNMTNLALPKIQKRSQPKFAPFHHCLGEKALIIVQRCGKPAEHHHSRLAYQGTSGISPRPRQRLQCVFVARK